MKVFCVSDLHLREDIPACRDSLFLEAQERKLRFLFELFQKENGDIILDAGDLFHKNKVSVKFVNYLIDIFRTFNISHNEYFLLMGNHDLPGYIKKEEAAAYTLSLAGVLSLIEESRYKEGPLLFTPFKALFILHEYVYSTAMEEKKGIIKNGYSPESLLKMVPAKSAIISGHSHTHFSMKKKGRCLLNPGGMTRQRINDTERGFYILDTESFSVIDVFFPYLGEIYMTSVLERELPELDKMFIERILSVERGCYSFRENVEFLLDNNDSISPAMRAKVYALLEKVGELV